MRSYPEMHEHIRHNLHPLNHAFRKRSRTPTVYPGGPLLLQSGTSSTRPQHHRLRQVEHRCRKYFSLSGGRLGADVLLEQRMTGLGRFAVWW